MSGKVKAAILCAGLVATLGACGKKAPSGQVVATVNGTEVTVNELNAELQGAQIPPGMDKREAQKSALQRVIDRKLFAEAATEKGLDKSPDYLAQKQKLDETLLAQAFVKQATGVIGNPNDADLQRFMGENPNVFGTRERLNVDQIRFAPPRDVAVLKALEPIKTQDGVAAELTKRGVEFQRGTTALDTAVMPLAVVRQIKALPAGEPFVLPGQGILTINVVTGSSATPIPATQAREIAVGGWKQKQFADTVKSRMDALKKSAKITYQKGYEPAPAGKQPNSATAAPPPPAPAG